MLQLVHLSKQHGFSLNEVKRYLRVQGNEQINCTLLAPLLQKKLEEIDQKIKALAAQRENLLQGIELLKMC